MLNFALSASNLTKINVFNFVSYSIIAIFEDN